MKKRENLPEVFFIFLFFSILIFSLSKTGVLDGPAGVFQKVLSPLASASFQSFSFLKNTGGPKLKKLEEENRNLLKQLVDQQVLKNENQALRDQFQLTNPRSQELIPAKIVGAPSFIPGVSEPSSFILDKGTSDGVNKEDAVVFADNLVGKIEEVNMFFSKVVLVTDVSSLISAKTRDTGAIGVIRGEGGRKMILDNVILSSDLKIGDIVVSKGDLDIKGQGYPPDLILGKIASIEKQPSALFQKAQVQSFLNFANLTTVFIVKTQ